MNALKLVIYFAASALLAALLGRPTIALMSKLKARQTVLGYVKQHEGKNGTPTMGGIIFLLPTIIFSLIEFKQFSILAASLTAGFALLGFLDDFIKVRYNRNLGLKPYQKIIGQLGLSGAAGYFVYASRFIGGNINLPFTQQTLNLSWGIIPIVIFIFVATANSVNLTDGLDGLAAGTSAVYFAGFTILLAVECARQYAHGDALYADQLFSLTAFCISLFGGVLGYLLFNGYPAKIMMGDFGSLGLGAAAACVAIFSKNPLLIISSGIMFVWSSISVILQVAYFKLTKKRIFLMSPFHHHLEMKGLSETRIVILYVFISMLGAALTFIMAGTV